MIRKLILIVITAPILFFSETEIGFCQGSSEEREDEIAAAREMGGYVTGTVIAVNPHTRRISIQDNDGLPHTFSVAKDTSLEGDDDRLKDISEGDEVTIDYYTVDGVDITDNIDVNKADHYDVTGDQDAAKQTTLEPVLKD